MPTRRRRSFGAGTAAALPLCISPPEAATTFTASRKCWNSRPSRERIPPPTRAKRKTRSAPPKPSPSPSTSNVSRRRRSGCVSIVIHHFLPVLPNSFPNDCERWSSREPATDRDAVRISPARVPRRGQPSTPLPMAPPAAKRRRRGHCHPLRGPLPAHHQCHLRTSGNNCHISLFALVMCQRQWARVWNVNLFFSFFCCKKGEYICIATSTINGQERMVQSEPITVRVVGKSNNNNFAPSLSLCWF